MVGRRLIKKKKASSEKLDKIVSDAKQSINTREKGYREQSLKLHPWVCGRCGKEFTRENLQMLTVHHIDHNHSNNPPDGSNWENLCIYCHDREHQKLRDFEQFGDMGLESASAAATNSPFADLKEQMTKK